ncbi:hypothetical protein TSAR_012495 [Trichomalopsis sarcophagae]|uniref:Uncharacterized protein n=1 Tax=Trichomalopsis sarcophagae TaxID=543379 RepID=A0A232F9V0_9HYME|nr:hypothetical protein TSAR_012495 [Trichomalopsis sarcophagae]
MRCITLLKRLEDAITLVKYVHVNTIGYRFSTGETLPTSLCHIVEVVHFARDTYAIM